MYGRLTSLPTGFRLKTNGSLVSIGIYTSLKALKGLDSIGGDTVPVKAPIMFSTLKGSDL